MNSVKKVVMRALSIILITTSKEAILWEDESRWRLRQLLHQETTIQPACSIKAKSNRSISKGHCFQKRRARGNCWKTIVNRIWRFRHRRGFWIRGVTRRRHPAPKWSICSPQRTYFSSKDSRNWDNNCKTRSLSKQTVASSARLGCSRKRQKS